ncbi:GyrI-like domain-containing protein [uncultured Lacinutrix sp.]|uniref:GyrI-like domain-containing protein n=1 Tax=uncultured Lacinutrix sp. TaxID=574032 RepID=UPI00262FED25|nr:GyrI-like domain-containing protein [uncultured Lacinutrix sp.]
MYKEPRIETLKEKKLVGQCIAMSLVDNKTFELFSSFMPNRKTIKNTISKDIYEVMIYSDLHFKNFNPTHTFEKWAALEVSNNETIPDNMRTFNLETGLYAVFHYKGLPQGFGALMTYIITQWIPSSNYKLDNRPHFNILGEKYAKGSPDSEEEVWIPIKKQ